MAKPKESTVSTRKNLPPLAVRKYYAAMGVEALVSLYPEMKLVAVGSSPLLELPSDDRTKPQLIEALIEAGFNVSPVEYRIPQYAYGPVFRMYVERFPK